jgi:hypothetical protein
VASGLARHRWVAAAGMTAAVAVVAGGGLALARHDSSPGPPEECGLVPCAAALPASVRSGGRESASAPATVVPTAAPTPTQRAAAPPSPVASATSPPASAAAPGAGPGSAGPGSAAPAGQPASADRVFVPAPRSSCTTVIAFTARGALSAPVRCRFTVAAVGQQRGRDGSGHPGSGSASQDSDHPGFRLRPGRSSHDGRLGSWLSGWLSQGWSGAAGWPGGGRSAGGWSGAAGWPGGGRSAGGWSGGGWPGGR